MKNTLLIDKSAIVYRLCFGRNVLNNEHEQIGGILAFVKFLFEISRKYEFHNIIIASEGEKNNRKILDPNYKKNRMPMPEFIKKQFKLVNELIDILLIPNISIAGCEADDVIYNLCQFFSSKEHHFTILSSDKDLCHSLKENVSLWMITNNMENIRKIKTKEEFKSFHGVHPDKYGLFLSLAGDSGDNVKGVRNIGPVTSKRLIEKFNSLDEIYENLDLIDEKTREKLILGKEDAYLSLELVKPQIIEKEKLLETLQNTLKDRNHCDLWMHIDELEDFTQKTFNLSIKKTLNNWF